MKLYKYENYEEYRKIQEAGNIKKLGNQWVKKIIIKRLANYIKRELPDAKFGICHGTRSGREQRWFRDVLGIDVIGTEISKTAKQFPHTIQWDFHEVKAEWLGSVDFIYSNSFDHSFDPTTCLDRWMSCIKNPGGFCIIDWSERWHANKETTGGLDPFRASMEELEELIKTKYSIKEKIPFKASRNNRCLHFIIEHITN